MIVSLNRKVRPNIVVIAHWQEFCNLTYYIQFSIIRLSNILLKISSNEPIWYSMVYFSSSDGAGLVYQMKKVGAVLKALVGPFRGL